MTGVAVMPYDGVYGAFLPGDSRGEFLTSLGFALPESVLDSDLLLGLAADENFDIVAGNPAFGNLKSVHDGAVVATTIPRMVEVLQ